MQYLFEKSFDFFAGALQNKEKSETSVREISLSS